MPLPLRTGFDAAAVRAAARRRKNAAQAGRLLSFAAVYDGATRTEAARIGGVTLQIVRDWVVKFNAIGPDGLIDRKPPGQPPWLTDTHRAALAGMIENGPIPAERAVCRLRTWLGRLARDIVRKIAGDAQNASACAPTPDLVGRLLRQRREDLGSARLYSLHAPEVECRFGRIARAIGKDHPRWRL